MAITQNHVINIQPGVSAPLVIHCSQGDTGTQINLTVVNGDEEFDCSSYACSVHGVRSDGGNWGPITCTVSGSTVCFSLTSAMTAVAGACLAEISVGTVGTANFAMLMENATFGNGVTYSNDVSVYQNILNAVNAEATARASADSNLQSQINQIVAPSGEAPSAAEVQNARIGADGVTYDTLGTAIRTQVSELKGDLSDLLPIANGELPNIEFKYGFITASNGNIKTSDKRIVTKQMLNFPFDLFITAKKGWRFGVYNYDENTDSGWLYAYKIKANTNFKLNIAFSSDISPSGTFEIDELLSGIILFNKYTYSNKLLFDYNNNPIKYGFRKFIDAPMVQNGILLLNGKFDDNNCVLSSVDLLKLEKSKISILNTFNLSREVKVRVVRYNLDGTVSGEEFVSTSKANRYDVVISDIENYLYRVSMWYTNKTFVITDEALFVAYTEDYAGNSTGTDIKYNKNSFIEVIAHQGGSHAGYVKNTLENVLACKKSGYDWLECDIRSTLDGVPVCWHDATINTYDGTETVTIAETNYSDLIAKQFFKNKNIKIAKVTDIIDKCKQYGLNIELDFKVASDDLVHSVLNYCKMKHIENNIAVNNFSQGTLTKFRNVLPNVTVCYSISSAPTESILESSTYQPLRTMLENGKVILAFNKSIENTDDYYRKLQEYGFYICIWTVNTSDYMTYVGVADYLTTETMTPDMLIN